MSRKWFLLLFLLLLPYGPARGQGSPPFPPSPPTPYVRLSNAYATYVRIAKVGPWSPVPPGPLLRQGDRGERVAALRKRLLMSGELKMDLSSTVNDVFDADLEDALSLFQDNYSLEPTGELNAATVEALNVPIERRIATLKANLDREAGEHAIADSRYVLVDIAKFQVRLYEHDRPSLVLKAIVGEKGKETPEFSARITQIELNPWWNMPRNIAMTEALPEMQSDPGELLRDKVEVVDVSGKPRVIDPRKVDWKRVSSKNFRYAFRQAPGPENPLGSILFRLPNPHLVFLHGTPDEWLFASAVRPFSHGCVRMDKPLALAERLLDDGKKTWTEVKLSSEITAGKRRTLDLPASVAIRFVYRTAWVDEDGQLQFRPDVYGWDPHPSVKFAE